MDKIELEIYRRRLPHWRLKENVYFVTWRLHETQKGLQTSEREIVKSAIMYFETERYDLYTYVVMDDHVHVLFKQVKNHAVKAVLHSWKSFTSHELVKKFGRESPVWQDESFDRIIRNEAEFAQKANYILSNPWERWPYIDDYSWVGWGKAD